MIHGRGPECSCEMTIQFEGRHLAQIMEPDSIGMSLILYRQEITSILPSPNLVIRLGHEIIETIPPTRHYLPHVHLSKSFTGTKRVLTIQWPRAHSVRREISGKDLLPAPDASLNPLLALYDPRQGDRTRQGHV